MTRGSTIFPARNPALFRAKRFAPSPFRAVTVLSALFVPGTAPLTAHMRLRRVREQT